MKKFVFALLAVMLLMFSCVALADSVDLMGTGIKWPLYLDNDGMEVGVNGAWTMCIKPGDTSTITLRDFNVEMNMLPSGLIDAFLSVDGDLNLVLEGANEISSVEMSIPTFGVYGNMTVSGSGSLEINAEGAFYDGFTWDSLDFSLDIPYAPITVNETLTMQSGKVVVNNVNPGTEEMHNATAVLVSNLNMQGGKLEAIADAYGDGPDGDGYGYGIGIVATGDITVSGGELYGEGDDYGVSAYDGNINVTGGSVEGVSAVWDSPAILASASNRIEVAQYALRSDGLNGGYINADGMNVLYNEDGNWKSGKLGMYEEEDAHRETTVYKSGTGSEDDYEWAIHAKICAPVPETGDAANLILWVGMIVLAGAALIMMKKRSFN